MDELVELARLLNERNTVDSKIVGRSARVGDVGEYIAARIFGIKL